MDVPLIGMPFMDVSLIGVPLMDVPLIGVPLTSMPLIGVLLIGVPLLGLGPKACSMGEKPDGLMGPMATLDISDKRDNLTHE